MNFFVIVIGLSNLLVSLIVSIGTIYFTFRFLHFITRDIDDIKELKNNNYSVAIYNASILFSVALVVKSSIQGAVSAITLLLSKTDYIIWDFLKTFGVMVAQILLSGIIAFFGVFIGIQVFTSLTRSIDEFKEVKKNNISIAIIVSVIIVIIAIFISPAVKTIVEGLVPYPSIIKNPN